jgi:GNAT superfamily N-acetyltransferase
MKTVASAGRPLHNTSSQMGNQADWIIRPAKECDYRAARLLLPHAVHFGSDCHLLVAQSNEQQIIAAAALSPRLRAEPTPGMRMAVHVIPPWRRRGIARALIDQLASIAHSAGAKAIYAWNAIPPGGEIETCWRALGFIHANPVEVGIADLQRAEVYLRPIYQQVIEHGWIPPEAKLIRLRQADHVQVAKLHAMYLGGTAQQVLARLSGPDPIDLDISPVLILNGMVKAFSLVRPRGKTCHVEATVVDPSLRGGWANLLLKYEGLHWALAAGATHIIFETYGRHSDTRKLFRQVGGKRQSLIEPYRLLDEPFADAAAPAAPVADAQLPDADRR